MSYGSDMLDKIKSNKSKSGNKVLLENTEGALTGSAIGLFLGLFCMLFDFWCVYIYIYIYI